MSIDINVQIDSLDILGATNSHDRRQLTRDIDGHEASVDFSLQTIREIAASLMRDDKMTREEIIAEIDKGTPQ